MCEPAYQELLAKDIPKVEKDGIHASIIAGEALRTKSKIYTRTPVHYIHYTMQPNKVLKHRSTPSGMRSSTLSAARDTSAPRLLTRRMRGQVPGARCGSQGVAGLHPRLQEIEIPSNPVPVIRCRNGSSSGVSVTRLRFFESQTTQTPEIHERRNFRTIRHPPPASAACATGSAWPAWCSPHPRFSPSSCCSPWTCSPPTRTPTWAFSPTWWLRCSCSWAWRWCCSATFWKPAGSARACRERSPHFVLHVDLSRKRDRRLMVGFVGGSLGFLFLTAFGSYETYHLMETNSFCGETCHTPMEPEYKAYQHSAHAQVDCVACHIGPGTTAYIRTKVNGVKQLYHQILGDYDRPIQILNPNLRLAQETCQTCHWSQKHFGDVPKTYRHFLADETNTPFTVQMILKVGGSDPVHGPVEGIHSHMNVSNKIEFIARMRNA